MPPTPVVPDGPTPTPISTVASGGMTSAEAGSTVNLEPPTPSPLFPRDLRSLFKLSPSDASTLVKEYGLGEITAPPSSEPPEKEKSSPEASSATATTPSKKNKEKKQNKEAAEEAVEDPGDIESREHNLNRFMAHIGVRAYLPPRPLTPKVLAWMFFYGGRSRSSWFRHRCRNYRREHHPRAHASCCLHLLQVLARSSVASEAPRLN